MKRKLITLTLAALWILSTGFAYAGAGRTAAQFLGLGGGTRASALAEAFVTGTEDVTTILWNPSGLSSISQTELTLSYNDAGERFGEAGEGIYYGFFAAAAPMGEFGALGASLQLNGQGLIDVTEDSPTVIRQVNLGTNWAFTLAYADQLTDNLSLGIGGKVIRQVLAEVSATAYAVDLGFNYDINSLPIMLGASVQNWGTRIQFKDANQSDPLPRILRTGVGTTLVDSQYHKARLLVDVDAFIDKLKEDDEEGLQRAIEDRLALPEYEGKTEEEVRNELEAERGVGIHALRWRNLQKSVGVEYLFGNMLALRAGYKYDPYIPNVANFDERLYFGFGVSYGNYELDYASTPGGGPENKRLNTIDLLIRF